MKICIIGCGLRTPLLIHGLAHSELSGTRLVLYDTAPGRAPLMTALGNGIAKGALHLESADTLEEAIRDCSFVISCIRPGEMQARARDERLAVECGYAGQETTGPAGFAMALRTVPVALQHAKLVEKLAPGAWIVNFTNPAGLITQAISTYTRAAVVGICDTPAELFFRISLALQQPLERVRCDYFGLNHLGWVAGVRVDNKDVSEPLLNDDHRLRSLYPANLFEPELIRRLRLIPTEYLYFYYNQRTAHANQQRVGATRGQELVALNRSVFEELESRVGAGDTEPAIQAYRNYLNRRNASYMHLEAAGTSAFSEPEVDWDPFAAATGYHRIAVDTIRALQASAPSQIVLNVANRGAIGDLAGDDVVEIPCLVDQSGPRALASRQLPAEVKGLVLAVKEYERLTIEAAINGGRKAATFALFQNPIVADWAIAEKYVDQLFSAAGTDKSLGSTSE